MSNIKYALRANSFGYNDEYYNLYDGGESGRICGVYDDLDSAMEAWKSLEYETLDRRPLDNIADFFELPTEKLLELDKFVFECCGEHVVESSDDGYVYVIENSETIKAGMTKEQVFEFVRSAGICSYKLIEYEADTKFYVCWLPEQGSYYFSRDDYDIDNYNSVCHASSVESLLDSYYYAIANEQQCYELTFTGVLDELSHSPEILRTLIATEQFVKYDEQQQLLSLEASNAFVQVYPLLINPPCEIREVMLEQLNEIQRSASKASVES